MFNYGGDFIHGDVVVAHLPCAKSHHRKIDNEKKMMSILCLLHQHADFTSSSQVNPSFHMNGKIAIASRLFRIDLEPMKWPKIW